MLSERARELLAESASMDLAKLIREDRNPLIYARHALRAVEAALSSPIGPGYVIRKTTTGHCAVCAQPTPEGEVHACPGNTRFVLAPPPPPIGEGVREGVIEECARVAETLPIGGGTLSSWVNTNESPMGATRRHIATAIRSLASTPTDRGDRPGSLTTGHMGEG